MGQLIYGAGTAYDMDDRTMSHVKIAVGIRLRRQESFYLTWSVPQSLGSGRVSIWLSPSIPLQFHFAGSRPVELNRDWLRALDATAFNEGGMMIMPESESASLLSLT